jgi:hypothetical protein
VIVLVIGFAAVALVWILGAVSSFSEQTALAAYEGFRHPALLPWTIDGLAFALAVVALAAGLDARPAIAARVGVVVTTAVSVWVNTRGVAVRDTEQAVTEDAYWIAAVAPISAVISLEVMLAAIRRLVFRLRGEPPPAAIPTLRPIRFFLAPWSSFRDWRRDVLAATAVRPVAIEPADYFQYLHDAFDLTGPLPGWGDQPTRPDPDPVTPQPVDPPPAPPFSRDVDRSDNRSGDQPDPAGQPPDRSQPVEPPGPVELPQTPAPPPADPPPPAGRRKVTDEALATAQAAYDRAMQDGHRMTDSELAPILGVSNDSARRIRRETLHPAYLRNNPPVRGIATAG